MNDEELWRVYAEAYNASEPISNQQHRDAHKQALRAVRDGLLGDCTPNCRLTRDAWSGVERP